MGPPPWEDNAVPLHQEGGHHVKACSVYIYTTTEQQQLGDPALISKCQIRLNQVWGLTSVNKLAPPFTERKCERNNWATHHLFFSGLSTIAHRRDHRETHWRKHPLHKTHPSAIEPMVSQRHCLKDCL